ncbi:MAG: hypothetical protein ABIT38_15305, partial [Gemmatimonadaceae bacterium]
LHLEGDFTEELRESRFHSGNGGDDYLTLLSGEVRSLAALGRAQEIDALLDRMSPISPKEFPSPGEVMLTAAEELAGHGHAADAPPILQRALNWFDARTDTNLQFRVESLHARALYQAGRLAEAEAIAKTLLRRDSTGSAVPWALLGTIAAHRGNRAEAERIAAHLATKSMNDLLDHVEVARAKIAMALGERDSALTHLERGCSRGCDMLLYMLESDHDLLPLHGDPRFKELLRPKG